MNKNKLFKKLLWESLFVASASLCVFSLGVTKIADSKSGVINDALGIKSSNIGRSDSSDAQYFKRTYGDDKYDELKRAYIDVAEEAESEGAVLLKNKNNALPLGANEKVSLMLSGSYHFSYTSSGSSSVDSSTYKSLKDTFSSKHFS